MFFFFCFSVMSHVVIKMVAACEAVTAQASTLFLFWYYSVSNEISLIELLDCTTDVMTMKTSVCSLCLGQILYFYLIRGPRSTLLFKIIVTKFEILRTGSKITR